MQTSSWQQFLRYLRFELYAARPERLLPLVVPPALYTLWALRMLLTGGAVSEWGSSSFSLGLLLGITTTVAAHRRELDASTANYYVLLPAGHFTRFATRWLLTYGLSAIGQVIILTVLGNIFGGVSALLGRAPWTFIGPEFATLRGELAPYLALHSIFFAGGIFFRRGAFFKTLILLIVYAGVLGLTTSILAFYGLLAANNFDLSQVFATLTAPAGSFRAAHFACEILLPLLLYAAAYYRARENEVRG